MDHKELRGVLWGWIELAQNKIYLWAVVQTVTKFWVSQKGINCVAIGGEVCVSKGCVQWNY